MELHRRVFGALSPLLLVGVFVVGFVVSTDVSRGADTSETDVQVIFVSGLSNLRGWKPDHARARVVRRGDDAALVTASRSHGVFALALRPGPRAKTVAGDEYVATAKIKTRRASRLICVYLRERDEGHTVGRIAECRVVGRRWTTLATSPYPGLEDGNRFVLDIFSVAQGGTTARRSFFLSSAKITRKCKSARAAAACGTSAGGTTTGTSSGGGGTTTGPGATTGTTSVVTTTTGATTTAPAPEPPPPTAIEGGAIDGVLSGAWVAVSTHDPVAAYDQQSGKPVKINQEYVNWRDASGATLSFPSWTQALCDAGITPEITWKQRTTSPNTVDASLVPDIIAGRLDGYIRARAQEAMAYSCDIFIRLFHEMNGNWYAFGRCSSSSDQSCAQPDDYRAAWRRVVRLFDEEGAADDVSFVWAPSMGQGDFETWYPGDAYVDWIGGDSYNFGTCNASTGGRWQGLDEMLHWDKGSPGDNLGWYDWALAKGKPLFISESGSAEQAPARENPPDKPAWVREIPAVLETHPQIKAWVQSDYTDTDPACNWQIDSSPATLQAYKDIALDPYLIGR